MARRALKYLLVAIVLLVGPAPGGRSIRLAQAQDDLGSPRRLSQVTLLQINDVYSTIPINNVGGLARVATLKQRLSAGGHPVLLLLAGDFLSPSVASSVFKGEQMVATLNAAGLDYATFGNHEFDFGIDVLKQRMAESSFTWVVSNVLDAKTGGSIGKAVPYAVRDVGGLTIGFIGLCITTSSIVPAVRSQFRFVDPMAAAAKYLPRLKRDGANVIVAITHLEFADDRALVRKFPQIDVVIGGHEHYPITAAEGRALVSKAGSDSAFAARIDLVRQAAPPSAIERFFELIPVTSAIPDDPKTAAVAAEYEARLGKELDMVVGTSTAALDATNARLVGETALGNLIADALREDVKADVGLSNAGGARGSRVYPAGPITRRTLLSIHPFGNIACKLAVSGRVLHDALEHGVSRLPAGEGRFPQTSGVTMRVDVKAPAGSRVSDVRVNGQPLDPQKTYTVGLPDFVMNGGDGYEMFTGQKVLVDPQSGDLVVTALEKYIVARGTVSPAIEGRITIAP
jgi:2',3'-cyclic-nucleotide 2'-phosphodiesterase (5'-nucleotidase family)